MKARRVLQTFLINQTEKCFLLFGNQTSSNPRGCLTSSLCFFSLHRSSFYLLRVPSTSFIATVSITLLLFLVFVLIWSERSYTTRSLVTSVLCGVCFGSKRCLTIGIPWTFYQVKIHELIFWIFSLNIYFFNFPVLIR